MARTIIVQESLSQRSMHRSLSRVVTVGIVTGALVTLPMSDANAQPSTRWPIHSPDRPQPRVVKPPAGTWTVPPPGDATVLFGGTDLSRWQKADAGGAPGWKVEQGYMEVVPEAGGIVTRDAFGDAQLHVEWMAPLPVVGESQDRGNSGVFLMGRYEVQVLDSYGNVTYADGQAAAVYGQYPPLVNVSRPPGEWQTYDIVFHRPRFDAAGKVTSPARLTVLHNGVLVQDNVVLSGPTANKARPPYERHPDRLPISLQDHGTKVRFRNIWIRDLERPYRAIAQLGSDSNFIVPTHRLIVPTPLLGVPTPSRAFECPAGAFEG